MKSRKLRARAFLWAMTDIDLTTIGMARCDRVMMMVMVVMMMMMVTVRCDLVIKEKAGRRPSLVVVNWLRDRLFL